MSDDLYQEILLYEARSTTYRGVLTNATLTVEGRNTSCGDALTLSLLIEQDKIVEARFDGVGCVLCLASASMLCAKLQGMTMLEILALTESDMVTMLGVAVGPMRLGCVTLGLKTLQKGLCSMSRT